jgi:DNA-binding winged helix-turn-helix (wHTH) protein
MRLRFGDYILDVARRELWRGCEPIVVEPQVFDPLVCLVQHPERVVTKDELLQAVNAARRVIADSGQKQRLIRTVLRKGLRFIGAVKKEPVESKGDRAAGSPSLPGHRFRLCRDASDDRKTAAPGRRRAESIRVRKRTA